LIFDTGSMLVRVQCKWAALVDDVVVVQVRPCRLGTQGYIRRRYTSDEIDAVAAYCGELDRCFLFVGDGFIRRATIHLRLRPTRNNQQRGVNWADAFDFGATLTALQGP
jgi:hypothetical protein